MEKIYYFKLKLEKDNGNPVLNIKPMTHSKRPIHYPIDFAELNVPIIVNNYSKGDSVSLDYFLDFEKSFGGRGENYNVFKKKNLLKVLHNLGVAIDEDLRKALCDESKLKNKITLRLDNGLDICDNYRLGSPRISSKGNGPRILKITSY